MPRPDPAALPDAPAATGHPPRGLLAWLEPYEVDEALAARFRARQLQAVQRLTRLAMVANVVNALAVMLALNPRLARTDLLAWAAVVVLMAAQGLFEEWRRARRPRRATASRRALHRLAAHSALLAAAWAASPSTSCWPRWCRPA